MNKRLLILRNPREFEQLVQKARARGIYTIVCDGYRTVRHVPLQTNLM